MLEVWLMRLQQRHFCPFSLNMGTLKKGQLLMTKTQINQGLNFALQGLDALSSFFLSHRGFAFVTFKHVEGARRATLEPTKIIDVRIFPLSLPFIINEVLIFCISGKTSYGENSSRGPERKISFSFLKFRYKFVFFLLYPLCESH